MAADASSPVNGTTPTPINGISTSTPGGRTLVLCFDGTSNHFQDKNTNVVRFFSLLDRTKPEKQVVYYQTGIGTYPDPGYTSAIGKAVSIVADLTVAYYLSKHVCEGYRFLMNTYVPGDRICIFGFSRGAYTARALAGMLRKVGLLPRNNEEHVPFAYKIYQRTDTDSWSLSERFRKTFSTEAEVKIEFVGVWDTVSSVGFLIPQTLPNTAYNPNVKTVRHALALDELRVFFKPNYWRNSELVHGKGPTDVKEVWFAGGHTDVGGGEVSDKAPFALAYIPLRWMVRECVEAHAGILFDDAALTEHGIVLQDTLRSCASPGAVKGALVDLDIDPRERERRDALSPSHSSFDGVNTSWWAIWAPFELLPLVSSVFTENLQWRKVIRPNLFRGREIWEQVDAINVHSSVKTRMEEMDYKPHAKWPGQPNFVD